MASSSLLIRIQDSQKAYTSRDVIHGEVILTTRAAEDIGVVAITFSGRGKTKLIRSNGNNRRIYRGRSPLFQYRTVLYQGHYTMKPDTYKWNFQFTFPSHTDPSCVEDSFDLEVPWMRTGESHLLPPSFKYYDNNARSQGMVEYKLEAEMHRPKRGMFDPKIETSRVLTFLPPRSDPDPDSGMFLQEQMYQLRTLKLLPDKAELTFKDVLNSVFKSSEVPTAAFIIRMIYPTVLFSERPIPIHIGVVSMTTSDDVPTQPAVVLRSMTVKIKSSYHFRASTALWNQTGKVEEEKHIFSNLNLSLTLPRADITGKALPTPRPQPFADVIPESYLDVAKLTRFGLVTPPICPSFSTINVAVGHRLKVKMRISCAGKDHALDFADGIFVVSPDPHAAIRLGSVGQGSSATANVTGNIAEDEGHQLPAYSANPQPGTTVVDVAQGGPSSLPSYEPSAEKTEDIKNSVEVKG